MSNTSCLPRSASPPTRSPLRAFLTVNAFCIRSQLNFADRHPFPAGECDTVSDVGVGGGAGVAPCRVMHAGDVVPHLLPPRSPPPFGGGGKQAMCTVFEREVHSLVCKLDSTGAGYHFPANFGGVQGANPLRRLPLPETLATSLVAGAVPEGRHWVFRSLGLARLPGSNCRRRHTGWVTYARRLCRGHGRRGKRTAT